MADTDLQATAQAAAQVPPPSRQGEPCEECGAPLAADQRYCLNCGRRRGGPRVDYRHYMGGGGAGEPRTPAPPQPPAGEEPAKPQRDYAPLAAVGGIAVLGLMLLVGVLIGKGNGDTASAPTQQVIRVPATAGESGGPESSGSSKGANGSGLGGGSKKAKGAGKGGGGTGNAVEPTTNELEEHSNASGESYEKESENLPNEIATPGKPPPIDTSKPPGGGEGGAEVIK